MRWFTAISVLGLAAQLANSASVPLVDAEVTPTEFLKTANDEYAEWSNKAGIASWNQSSNITDHNTEELKKVNAQYAVWRKELGARAKAVNFTGLAEFEKRQFEKFAVIGTSALSEEDGASFSDVGIRMKQLYSTATVRIQDKNMELEPDLVDIMATSNDSKLLKDVWVGWRDATGPKMRQDYIQFFTLGNKAAKLNSLPDKSFNTFDDLWMAEWETEDLKVQIDNLMEELRPLYEKIHAFVRFHLGMAYPDEMPEDGTIPAHLVGNMWAQQWGNLLNIIPEMNPNINVEPIDKIVNEILDRTYTEEKMFELSEKFFNDLSMNNMTEKFWDRSILKKPLDVKLTCHASAWDFYDKENDDFRIKQCTEKTMGDLVTVHHEMGHIQYYMNYYVQPPIYRRGANPGFHEAIGDLIALSVSTPAHLEKVKLFQWPEGADENTHKAINLNYQMKMALDKIAFLPFAYVMDKWRWDVFGDESMKSKLNRRWWELRLAHQGISPPVKRSENDFDPGAKYHIPANTEYVRYFVSHVLQFMFQEKMCSFVGDFTEETLSTCDFDNNQAAGAALKKMLAHGSSKKWPEILEEFTGSTNMTLKSLNKYFGPLNKYLDTFIGKNNITLGWKANVDDYMENSVSNILPGIYIIVSTIILSIFASRDCL